MQQVIRHTRAQDMTRCADVKRKPLAYGRVVPQGMRTLYALDQNAIESLPDIQTAGLSRQPP
jgi:hypothetical protein